MEWEDEPDREEVEIAGFRGLILRNPSFGTLNGYLEIPKDHPFFGTSTPILDMIPSHGDWTWHAQVHPETGASSSSMWIGFDCCHIQDLKPYAPSLMPGLPGLFDSEVLTQTYRNIEYVREIVIAGLTALNDALESNVTPFKGRA